VDVDEKFAFVSLDMDLYKPTLEGLRYFYPRMSRGGIIAIHDFFSDAYPNIKQSVYEYEEEISSRLCLVPVGDDISIAIVKP
jgi:predicted O-methyltransferase YrrM